MNGRGKAKCSNMISESGGRVLGTGGVTSWSLRGGRKGGIKDVRAAQGYRSSWCNVRARRMKSLVEIV